MSFSDKALIVLFISLIIFISVNFYMFFMFQSVPDSLVVGFFGLFGAECGILGFIKNLKTKKEIALSKAMEEINNE